jgi:probable rRNA maturation factor
MPTQAPRFQFFAADGKALVPYLRKHLRTAAPLLPTNSLRDVAVALVGDAEMSRLHLASHADPTPTDVLTYELEHGAKGAVTEGQIVICIPFARRAAGERTIALPAEVLLYALHGVLHLCGLDDRNARDFKRMHALEDDILGKLGVGAVFDPAGSVRRGQPRNKPAAMSQAPKSHSPGNGRRLRRTQKPS